MGEGSVGLELTEYDSRVNKVVCGSDRSGWRQTKSILWEQNIIIVRSPPSTLLHGTALLVGWVGIASDKLSSICLSAKVYFRSGYLQILVTFNKQKMNS